MTLQTVRHEVAVWEGEAAHLRHLLQCPGIGRIYREHYLRLHRRALRTCRYWREYACPLPG